MTLESLLIQNFQTHAKLKVEFDEKVTTIVGSSDVGKSSILRALKWVCQNYPPGYAFIRSGEKGATVQLILDDQKIGRKRKRGQGLNTYSLDKKEYKSFGSDVPSPIADVLDLGDVNFQNQHDAPFWFSLTAGEVSRQINSIIDLGVIDESLSSIGRKVNHNQQTVKIGEHQLVEAKERVNELVWIIEADQAYSNVEKQSAHLREITSKFRLIRITIDSMRRLIEVRDTLTSQRIELIVVGKQGQKAQKFSKRRSELSMLVLSAKLQDEVLKKDIPDITHLNAAMDLYNEKVRNRQVLMSTLEVAKRLKERVLLTQDRHKMYGEQFEKETEGICPICGREIKWKRKESA